MSSLTLRASVLSAGLLVAVGGLALTAPANGAAEPRPKAVKFCTDARYKADCLTTKGSVDDFGQTVVGNDYLSSVKIKPGTWVALYQDVDFSGPCQSFSSNVRDLAGSRIGNDNVSSARLSTFQLEECATE